MTNKNNGALVDYILSQVEEGLRKHVWALEQTRPNQGYVEMPLKKVPKRVKDSVKALGALSSAPLKAKVGITLGRAELKILGNVNGYVDCLLSINLREDELPSELATMVELDKQVLAVRRKIDAVHTRASEDAAAKVLKTPEAKAFIKKVDEFVASAVK